MDLNLEYSRLSCIFFHLIIFRECYVYLKFITDWMTYDLFFKSRNKLTASQFKRKFVSLTAFKRSTVHKTFKIYNNLVLKHRRSVIDRNNSCISLLDLFDLSVNIRISYILDIFWCLYTLIISNGNFRLCNANCFKFHTVFLVGRNNFNSRSINKNKFWFFNCVRHFWVDKTVDSFLIEYAFTVILFNKLLACLTLSEAGNSYTLLLSLISFFNSCWKGFSVYCEYQFMCIYVNLSWWF